MGSNHGHAIATHIQRTSEDMLEAPTFLLSTLSQGFPHPHNGAVSVERNLIHPRAMTSRSILPNHISSRGLFNPLARSKPTATIPYDRGSAFQLL
jgi:hypothetical protein